jgi:hypothetical protein
MILFLYDTYDTKNIHFIDVDIKRSSVTTASLVTDTKRNTSKIQTDQSSTETFNTSSNKGHRATTKYNPALNSSNDGSLEYVTNSHFAALPTTSHLLTNNTQSEYSNATKGINWMVSFILFLEKASFFRMVNYIFRMIFNFDNCTLARDARCKDSGDEIMLWFNGEISLLNITFFS